MKTTLDEFFDSYNAIYNVYESDLKEMQSFSTECLKEAFDQDNSYLQSLITSVNRHEKIAFLHNTPVIPGVGLLGSIKQKRENEKFLNTLEIKIFDNKGIHQLTQTVAEKIHDMCSIQAELKKRGAASIDELNRIKTIYKNCENALNTLSNDAFAYNYETSQGDCQLWGILTLACEKHLSTSSSKPKKKGFFKSLFG